MSWLTEKIMREFLTLVVGIRGKGLYGDIEGDQEGLSRIRYESCSVKNKARCDSIQVC